MTRLLTISFFVFCFFNISVGQIEVKLKAFESLRLHNEGLFNTNDLEFSPFFYNDFIGFVYANSKSDMDEAIDEHFFDIGIAGLNIDGYLDKRAGLSKFINSEFHEGPASFVSSTGELFFTRAYYDKSKTTFKDTIERSIYVTKTNTNFSNIKKLNLFEEQHSTCHPSLNPSGTVMTFASDHSSSKGKMDLYSSVRNSGRWEQTKNLAVLNSEFNEIFPFIYQDSVLFFASDRPGGKGGLDIYVSTKTDTAWTAPILLPYPVNTIYDDFGLIIDEKLTKGYLTSSRPGGKGKDDIFSFSITEKLWSFKKPTPIVNVSITILDKLTLLPIADAQLSISDVSLNNNKYDINDFNVDVLAGNKNGEIVMKLSPKANQKITDLISNEKGIASFHLPNDKKYLIRCSSNGYEDGYVLYDPKTDDNKINIVINPKPKPMSKLKKDTIEEVFIPTKIGEVVVFDNIYYDRNSHKIKPGAAKELDALLKAMIANPDMKVELAAHSDSRGDIIYNQNLSIKRAASAKDYLIYYGVAPSRIRAIGYGESKIRNHCIDGVNCTEEEHEYNRRTEVTIIK